jgi:cytidylate kinase
MPSRVVCISSSDGAGAEAVGRAVARALGFRLVDEHVVAHAAQTAGVPLSTIAGVERRKSFVARLIEDHGPTTSAAAVAMGGIAIPLEDGPPPTDELRSFIRAAIEDIAAEGDVVIVAHAASHALADGAATLRVLVTASPATRQGRLAQARGIEDGEAGRLLRKVDANRADYLKRFYGVGEELPTHYDLVLSTDRLTPEQAADIVVHAARGGD